MSEKQLHAEDFEDKIGTNFTLHTGLDDETVVVLKLVDCNRRPPQNFEGRFRDPFNILFEGARNMLLPQQMYTFTHDQFDEPIVVFIVPVGQTDTATQYEAVFT